MILPKAATDYFDQRAEQVLAQLEPPPAGAFDRYPSPVGSDLHVRQVGPQDVQQVHTIGTVDWFGNTQSMFVPTKGGLIGLGPDRYPVLAQLAERLAARPELRRAVSQGFVETIFFRWIVLRREGGDVGFSTYLGQQMTEAVGPYTVTIPIENVLLEEAFDLGAWRLITFPRAILDEMDAKLRANPDPEAIGAIERGMDDLRRRFQGRACCQVTVTAERERAIELAVESTDDALMVLRLYSPAVFEPASGSYVGRAGTVLVPGTELYLERSGRGEFEDRSDDRRIRTWPLEREFVRLMRADGLDLVARVVQKDEPSELEGTCIAALRLLDRSTRSNDLLDKSVFALAAAETLVLKSADEPVVGPAGLRLAILGSDDVAERGRAVQAVKDAHAIRSAYLHHGKRKEDVEVVRRLFSAVRAGLLRAFAWTTSFETRAQFFDHLDRALLSGDAKLAAPNTEQ